MSVNHFDCKICGKVSLGPFMPAALVAHGFTSDPRCKNDECPDQWWNRMFGQPLMDISKNIARTHALGLGVDLSEEGNAL